MYHDFMQIKFFYGVQRNILHEAFPR